MSKKVAIVTGSNRGIGYAIVKGLCEKFDGDVYLTARDEVQGLAAVKRLEKLGHKPKFHLLDITDPESIQKLRDHIVQQYEGLDILVNNAGYEIRTDPTDPLFSARCREIIQVNYFGILMTCNILFHILKPHARVVNVSSSAGHLSRIPGKHLRDIFASPNLTEEELDNLMTSFIRATENGTLVQEGWPTEDWPTSPYIVSKVGVSALSRIQHKKFLEDKNRTDIVLNHVHPGSVNTDMNTKGRLTIEQGAEAPVFLALLPHNCTRPRGDYIWFTKEIVDWVNGPLPITK